MKLIDLIAFCVLFSLGSFVSPHQASAFPLHINQSVQDRYTPLMRAAERGQVNAVRALLKRGAEVDAKDPAGLTALCLAVRQGHVPVVKVLLGAGANPNVSVGTPHAGEVSPLIWGIMSGNQLMVHTLLKAGAEVNPRTKNGSTPLIWAVHSRKLGIIKTLLAARADVNARMFNGYTALMVSVEQFEPALTRTLIAAGADVKAMNKFGETPLALARKERNDVAIGLLKRAGAKE